MDIQDDNEQFYDVQTPLNKPKIIIKSQTKQWQFLLDYDVTSICIGRKDYDHHQKVKVKHHLQDAKFPQNSYMSNQHALLTFYKTNIKTKNNMIDMILLKSGFNLPKDILQIIGQYLFPLVKIFIEDLGSISGTFLSNISKNYIQNNQTFYIQNQDNILYFQNIYSHIPEGKPNFKSERERLNYYFSKSHRLISYLRNCQYKKILNSNINLQNYNENDKLQMCNLNQILYSNCFIVIMSHKMRGYAFISTKPEFAIDEFSDYFVGRICKYGLNINSKYELFNNVCNSKTYSHHQPSNRYQIKQKQKLILGNTLYRLIVK